MGLTVRHAGVTSRMEIAVVQVYIVESKITSQRMNMHLTYALGIVSGGGQFACHRVFIVPRNIILIPDSAMMALFHASVQSGPCGNAAWACAVRMVKDDASGSQCVKVRGLYIRVPGESHAVAS